LAGYIASQHREGIIMNVSLTPELEKFVDAKVESGLYNNASEVVREGLRLLKEHDEIRVKWREQIERGWLQAQRGEVVDGPTAMAELRERVKTKARKRA
jgi:antitoxin ParD1/3/4